MVERYRAVESFVSETFWKIKVNHTMNNLSVDFSWDRIRLFDQEACQIFHDMCIEDPRATVTEVKTKPKSKWRPLPLDTVELEKLASKKLKINAKETMKLAEKLYTQGFISYPRTETNEYPREMNLAQLVEFQTGDPNWGQFAQNILDSGGPTPRQGNKTDRAHPPIHPTKYTDNLSGNEKRLYEFIVRSFLACCSKDAQGQETTVTINIADELFYSNGLIITARNYLDVYPYDKWSSKEIHAYENEQSFNPTSIDMIDGSTSPPNLLTEADLISLMEKHGIGTDATHADHIETIKSRCYVDLANAIHFVPGFLGMGLVEGYDAMGLDMSKPHLRAQLEADLKAISEGRREPQTVLAEQIAIYKEVYIKATAEAIKIDRALGMRFNEQPTVYTPPTQNLPTEIPTVLKCPKCGKDMVLRKKKNSDEYYIGCISYPNCKNAVWFPPSIVRTVEVLQDTCNECGTNYKKLKFQWRNNSISHLYPPPYIGCIGGCDRSFLEVMNLHLSSVQRIQETQISRNTNANVSRNVNTNTIRNNATPSNISNPRPQAQAPPAANSNQQRRTPALPQPSNLDNEIMCYCNQQALLLTSRRQNENFGKQFYKCSKGKDNGGCDYFAWTPNSNDGVNGGPSTSGWGTSRPTSNNNGCDNNIKCDCGVLAKKLTTQKEGKNQGREFYTCQKPVTSRCNFFQWADTPASVEWNPAGNSNRGTNNASRGRGSGRGGTNTARGPRKCTICRQEGHTRLRCPNKE